MQSWIQVHLLEAIPAQQLESQVGAKSSKNMPKGMQLEFLKRVVAGQPDMFWHPEQEDSADKEACSGTQ